MDNSVTESLILDLLEWLAKRDRSYEEVMKAAHIVPQTARGEDANDRGLVVREQVQRNCIIRITPSALALLRQRKLIGTR